MFLHLGRILVQADHIQSLRHLKLLNAESSCNADKVCVEVHHSIDVSILSKPNKLLLVDTAGG